MTLAEHAEASRPPRSRRALNVVFLSWIAMLGFDFFLHGGLLASLYSQPSSFLLDPMDAFRRIPIGYLGFLIAAGFVVWILSALHAHDLRRGLIAGTAVGAAMWGSLGLGLYSISTAKPLLLAAWAAGQTVEMAYAGAIAGYALGKASLKRPYVIVFAATIGLVILTIAAQSLGLAPTTQWE